MSPTTGHIDRVEEFDAADDVAAVALVRERDHPVAVELWQEGRKIIHIPGHANVAQPSEPIGLHAAFGT